MMAKFLIDECLHTSLLGLARAAGHLADHVNYLGLAGAKDRELMTIILERDYIFVTNNRSDFLALYGQTPVHAGLVVVVPNVAPALQRELFVAVLEHIGQRELVNAVVEADYFGDEIRCRQYPLPPE
jgi:predicted nuclease of predicted toxin-antitoxin system